MAGNDFNFKGGDKLRRMGASWFVSYSFFTYKDKSHTNWEKISTCQARVSVFNRTKDYHEFWLGKILEMDDKRLNTNEIGLDAKKVKEMAQILLTNGS